MSKQILGYGYVIIIDEMIIWNLRFARSPMFIYCIWGKREKFYLLLFLRTGETQN